MESSQENKLLMSSLRHQQVQIKGYDQLWKCGNSKKPQLAKDENLHIDQILSKIPQKFMLPSLGNVENTKNKKQTLKKNQENCQINNSINDSFEGTNTQKSLNFQPNQLLQKGEWNSVKEHAKTLTPKPSQNRKISKISHKHFRGLVEKPFPPTQDFAEQMQQPQTKINQQNFNIPTRILKQKTTSHLSKRPPILQRGNNEIMCHPIQATLLQKQSPQDQKQTEEVQNNEEVENNKENQNKDRTPSPICGWEQFEEKDTLFNF